MQAGSLQGGGFKEVVAFAASAALHEDNLFAVLGHFGFDLAGFGIAHDGSQGNLHKNVVVVINDDDVVIKDDDDEDVVIKNDDDEEEVDYEPVFIAHESDEDEESEAAKDLHNKKMTDPNAPKPAFCINDRFRFRRELFNNSDSAFNSAMDLVATMDDYEEAEDYFIGDLGWDLEKPEVMDFMAIIRNYFEK